MRNVSYRLTFGYLYFQFGSISDGNVINVEAGFCVFTANKLEVAEISVLRNAVKAVRTIEGGAVEYYVSPFTVCRRLRYIAEKYPAVLFLCNTDAGLIFGGGIVCTVNTEGDGFYINRPEGLTQFAYNTPPV